MNSPFKFLNAYDKEDRDIFFGRAGEIELLYETTFKTDLMLVYGQSGTGKTSLIQCGLANRFRDTDWFDLRIRRWGDINESLYRKIREKAQTPIDDGASVSEAIQSLYLDYLKPVYLIFDQFEELFILGGKEEQREFFKTMGQLLDLSGGAGHTRVSCKIIFVMREEYIAWLYDFERAVPRLFEHRIRVEPMNLSNVEAVIRGSAEAFGIGMEEADTTVQQIILNNKDRKGTIHLPYLQVYLDRLFHEAEVSEEPVVFTPDLVSRVGQIENAMAVFLAEQTVRIQDRLREEFPEAPEKVVWQVLDQFVTLDGTNSPMSKENLYSRLHQPQEVIDYILGQLEKSRILHVSEQDRTYEIAHDALAVCIDDKRTAEEKIFLKVEKLAQDRFSSYKATESLLTEGELDYISPHEDKLKERLDTTVFSFVEKSKRVVARHRTRLLLITITLAVIFAALAVVAGLKWRQADREKKAANASWHEAKALSVAHENPTLALRFAEKALKIEEHETLNLASRKLYFENSFYKVIARQDNAITSAALSPDGKRILTGSRDGIARLWNADGTPYRELPIGGGIEITSVAFSPDGNYMLIGSKDKHVRVYDNKGAHITGFSHEDAVTSVAFSPDSQYILTGSDDKTAVLWDVNVDKVVSVSHDLEVTSVAFFPGGEWFVTGSRDKSARVWDLKGTPVHRFIHEYTVTCVAVSRDGRFILTGSDDNIARLWDLEKEKVEQVFSHDGSIEFVGFSPDNKHILTGSEDKTARFWNYQGTQLYVLKGHKERVSSVLYGQEGNYIVTVSLDKTMRKWHLHRTLKSVFKHPHGIECLAYSPDGKYIFTGSFDHWGRLWDTDGTRLHRFRHRGVVEAVVFMPGGQRILTASADNYVRLWSLKGTLLNRKKLDDVIESLDVSPDGSYFLTGNYNGFARLFKIENQPPWGIEEEWRDQYEGAIEAARFSPQGDSFFVGVNDGLGYLLDMEGNSKESFSNDSGIESAVFSPQGDKIFIGYSNDTACLWNIDGSVKKKGFRHSGIVESVAFSPDGKWVLTGSKDKTACLWDLDGNLLNLYKHMREVESVAFSPYGGFVLTGSRDKTARLWLTSPMPFETFLKSVLCENFSDEELEKLSGEL
jgi:WD40 repeat protein